MPIDDAPERPIEQLVPLLINVEHDLSCEMPLESLARQYGYSAFHFHRFFSGAVGETPKQYVNRLRLERAAYKLAITADTILQIALSVGFKNHETFSRAFKRAYGCSPRDYRRACRAAQAERLDRNCGFRGDGCLLSPVHFVTLPTMALLAIRRHGAYEDCPVPFSECDGLWSRLVEYATSRGISHRSLPLLIPYDDPTVTPPALQRLDACLPIDDRMASEGPIRMFDFAGGCYGGIEHTGSLSTIDQAYRALADGIRRSRQYVFNEGPPIQIYRKLQIGGDFAANLTEVYFPVRPSG